MTGILNRYVNPDSWLFDYKQKETLLNQVFDKTIIFPYSKEDMVKTFMEQIGYSVTDGDSIRLNVTNHP